MSELDTDKLAPDDSRRLLREPEQDLSKRHFFPYYSPRPGRVHVPYGARLAQVYLSFGRSERSPQGGLMRGHSFRPIKD